MNWQLLNITVGLVGFLLFVLLQSLFINGVKSSMEEGMIFEGAAKWVRKYIKEWIAKPLTSCIKCMSSAWGGVTYWPVVVLLFDFQLWQVGLFVVDVFILTYLNFYLYKRQ